MNKTRLKQDDAVMKALEVKVIRRLICKTDKGELELVIRKGENNYFLTLDAVPLEKQENKELMDVLFPVVEVPKVDKLSKEDFESIKPLVDDKITDTNANSIKKGTLGKIK